MFTVEVKKNKAIKSIFKKSPALATSTPCGTLERFRLHQSSIQSRPRPVNQLPVLLTSIMCRFIECLYLPRFGL